MTKIVPSAFIGSISGKSNGSVFRRGQYGLNLARKAKPPQSPSNARNNCKARFTNVMSLWATLSAAQVLGWNTLASHMKGSNVFGDKFTYSGIAIFQRLNNHLINAGIAPILDAPILAGSGIWTAFSATGVHDGAISIAFAASPIPAGSAVVMEATAPVPVSRKVKESDFRQVAVLAAADTTPHVLTTAYQAKFGTKYAAGKTIYFRAYFINTVTGEAGQPLQCSALLS